MLFAAQVNWSQWKSSLSCTRSVIGLSLTFCCPVRLGNIKPSSLRTFTVLFIPQRHHMPPHLPYSFPMPMEEY